MAICGFCGLDVPGQGGVFKHQWDEHKELMEQRRQRGISTNRAKAAAKRGMVPAPVSAEKAEDDSLLGQRPDNGSKPQPQKKLSPVAIASGSKLTGNISEAVSVSISPRTFNMDSSLLWSAMEAAKREWHWPANMTPQQFLDTYLYESFRQRGLLLGGYQVLWPQVSDVPDVIDNNGNGHRSIEAVSDEYGQKEPDPVMASF